MTQTTHTPGPWFIDGTASDDCLDVYHHNGRICMIYCDSTQNPTAEDLAEAEANARLIAAAPDLLAALSNIILSSDANCGDSLANAIEAARNAINKAKGQ